MVRLVVRLRVVGGGWVVGWLWNIGWSWFVGWLRNIGGNRLWNICGYRGGVVSRLRNICGNRLRNICGYRGRSRVIGGFWNICWCRFMVNWRRGVRGWRVGWRRHRGVLSLSSDLLTAHSLDWEAVEGGEVLLAVGLSGHQG